MSDDITDTSDRSAKVDWSNCAGKTIGYWTVIGRIEGRRIMVRCVCGRERLRDPHDLIARERRLGNVSCGCKRPYETRCGKQTHGDFSHRKLAPERQSWRAMLARCTNPSYQDFDRYGGRGISVCDRWSNSYVLFLEDMGRKPSSDYTIERVNNDGNYEPGNCRWATKKEQGRNKSNSRMLSFRGETMALAAWEERTGLGRSLEMRLRSGWPLECALTHPPKAGRKWCGPFLAHA